MLSKWTSLFTLLVIHSTHGRDVTFLETYAWPLKESVILFLDNELLNSNDVLNNLSASCRVNLKKFSDGLKTREIWSMKSE